MIWCWDQDSWTDGNWWLDLQYRCLQGVHYPVGRGNGKKKEEVGKFVLRQLRVLSSAQQTRKTPWEKAGLERHWRNEGQIWILFCILSLRNRRAEGFSNGRGKIHTLQPNATPVPIQVLNTNVLQLEYSTKDFDYWMCQFYQVTSEQKSKPSQVVRQKNCTDHGSCRQHCERIIITTTQWRQSQVPPVVTRRQPAPIPLNLRLMHNGKGCKGGCKPQKFPWRWWQPWMGLFFHLCYAVYNLMHFYWSAVTHGS